VERLRWSDEIILSLAESAPWLSAASLPRVAPAGAIVGSLTDDAATRLGLSTRVVVVAGSHDQAAGFVGAGGLPGVRSAIAFGSSDCVSVGSIERPAGLEDTGFASYPVDDSMWVTLAGTAAGGWAL